MVISFVKTPRSESCEVFLFVEFVREQIVLMCFEIGWLSNNLHMIWRTFKVRNIPCLAMFKSLM